MSLIARINPSTGYTPPITPALQAAPTSRQGLGVQPGDVPPPSAPTTLTTGGGTKVADALASFQDHVASSVTQMLLWMAPVQVAHWTPAEEAQFVERFKQAGQALEQANERLGRARQDGAPPATLNHLARQQREAQSTFDILNNVYLPALLQKYQQEATPTEPAKTGD